MSSRKIRRQSASCCRSPKQSRRHQHNPFTLIYAGWATEAHRPLRSFGQFLSDVTNVAAYRRWPHQEVKCALPLLLCQLLSSNSHCCHSASCRLRFETDDGSRPNGSSFCHWHNTGVGLPDLNPDQLLLLAFISDWESVNDHRRTCSSVLPAAEPTNEGIHWYYIRSVIPRTQSHRTVFSQRREDDERYTKSVSIGHS